LRTKTKLAAVLLVFKTLGKRTGSATRPANSGGKLKTGSLIQRATFKKKKSVRREFNTKDTIQYYFVMLAKGDASALRVQLLLLMVLQNSLTVLVGRYCQTAASEEDKFSTLQLVLVCELVKLFASCLLQMGEESSGSSLMKAIDRDILSRPRDFMKMSVPAGLYFLQNNILYVALNNLTAPVFQVTYQTKLLTTAVMSVVMLNRKYKPLQWVALTALGIGVAIVVLGESKKSEEEDAKNINMFKGLVAVTIACTSSAFAGVYFEKVLKSNDSNAVPVSLWMRNMQLSFFSILVALMSSMTAETNTKAFLHGFTPAVWVLVGLQAGGGLLVAAVVKYADNVVKGLATGCAVVLSTFLSVMFMGTELSFNFVLGSAIILSSVYSFSNPDTVTGWLKSGGDNSANNNDDYDANGNIELGKDKA